jgi:hypothetical protein
VSGQLGGWLTEGSTDTIGQVEAMWIEERTPRWNVSGLGGVKEMEFVYLDHDGKARDADLFAGLLTPEANAEAALAAVEAAVARGMPREDAEVIYGVSRGAVDEA